MLIFIPPKCADPPPVLVDLIEIMRVAVASPGTINEKRFEDCWGGSNHSTRPLSDVWIGSTTSTPWKDATAQGVSKWMGGKPASKRRIAETKFSLKSGTQ